MVRPTPARRRSRRRSTASIRRPASIARSPLDHEAAEASHPVLGSRHRRVLAAVPVHPVLLESHAGRPGSHRRGDDGPTRWALRRAMQHVVRGRSLVPVRAPIRLVRRRALRRRRRARLRRQGGRLDPGPHRRREPDLRPHRPPGLRRPRASARNAGPRRLRRAPHLQRCPRGLRPRPVRRQRPSLHRPERADALRSSRPPPRARLALRSLQRPRCRAAAARRHGRRLRRRDRRNIRGRRAAEPTAP